MKIYTKTGDQGETGLYGGGRVPKDDLRIQTYGSLDELNAALGIVLANAQLPLDSKQQLLKIQGELFQLGAELATPRGRQVSFARIEDEQVHRLEKTMDQMEAQLTPLRNFILPGGSEVGAWIHMARTICRRAERELITLHRGEPQRQIVLQYLNRLSDYLFVLARFVNQCLGVGETPWIPSK